MDSLIVYRFPGADGCLKHYTIITTLCYYVDFCDHSDSRTSNSSSLDAASCGATTQLVHTKMWHCGRNSRAVGFVGGLGWMDVQMVTSQEQTSRSSAGWMRWDSSMWQKSVCCCNSGPISGPTRKPATPHNSKKLKTGHSQQTSPKAEGGEARAFFQTFKFWSFQILARWQG